MSEIKRFKCARCGCSVSLWYHGWKHQRGWRSPLKSCGMKPVPVPAKPLLERAPEGVEFAGATHEELARAIEAKLKEKNA